MELGVTETLKTSSSKESATQPLSGLFLFSLLSAVYSASLPEAEFVLVGLYLL